MRQRFPHLKIQQYISRNIIEKVYTALDVPLPASITNTRNKGGSSGLTNEGSMEESDGEEVAEEMDEDGYDDDDMIWKQHLGGVLFIIF